MTLSIIIPVYRVERTLDRCVASIVSQEGVDMEIILVDDGSPDNCPAICDSWGAKHKNVKVVHKKNGGLSDARNVGIGHATGEYITFVDSDDYLEASTYRQVLDFASRHPECDIIEYAANLFEGSAKEQRLEFADHVYTDVGTYWHATSAYQHCYACNKVFKRGLFDDVRFPVGKVFEDVHTFPFLLLRAHAVGTSASGTYHYCANSDGITAQADGDAWRTLLDAHLQIQKIHQLSAKNDEHYYMQLVNIQIYTNELTGDEPKIPEWRFHHTKNIKSILVNTIGIRRLCKLNRIMRKFIRRH